MLNRSIVRRSIVGRLTLWYTLSVFILVFLTTTFLYWTLQRTLKVENEAFLHDRLQTIRNLLKHSPDPLAAVKKRIESEWSSWQFERLFVQIRDQNGTILIQSSGIPAEFYSTLSDQIKMETMPGKELKVYLALDLNNEKKILEKYRERLILVLIGAFLISCILGIRLAKSAFKPVQKMIDTASVIRSTNLHERIEDLDLPLELKQLAFSINTMLERLETAFDRLSRFSSDIAHELRTPLNNLRGEIEVTLGRIRAPGEYQELLQSSLEEIERLSQMIDGLLFLARTENPKNQIRKESLSLSRELAKIVEFYEPAAAEGGIEIEVHADVSQTIVAERTLFQRCIGNILSNAINYTPRGGQIRVTGLEDEKETIITVADTGPGISKEDLPHIFDRFYRSDSARSPSKLGGYGLGLTIVKSILRLHDGEIEIESEPNSGTQVFLRFPRGSPSMLL